MLGATMLGSVESRRRQADPVPVHLEHSRRANRRILVGFSVALQAARRGAFDVAALAMSRCEMQLHEVQRFKALHLYPVIARRCADDADAAEVVAAKRREANAMLRHFLNLVEGLYTPARPRMPDPVLIAKAERALAAYFAGKEAHLYRACSVVQEASPADPPARRR